MRRPLSQLFQVPADLDYVNGFQELARLNLQLRREGPSVELLLRRASLERAVGNHRASLDAVLDAQRLAPDHAEVQYELGVTYFFLAMSEAGALPVGPLHRSAPTEGVRALLSAALDAFTTVIELNPADAEAARDLGAIADLLAAQSDDLALAESLRSR